VRRAAVWGTVSNVTAEGVCVMKKPERAGKSRDTRLPMPDDEFAAAYPTITDYLCSIRWDDGSPRVASTLTVFLQDGGIKISVNDKDGDRGLFVTAESLREALALAERALQADNPPWRSYPGGKWKK